ncbi:IS3 family transposase [Pseudoflavonifractor hominis]|uniref:IS3 family transposase n=1 Tax=Pseudoflavonifractor hominis TaxID=2763059 RepID=A0ABR7HPV2_9FIRM|nr:IS3 family transposase [Pseudoflavonifractor hominis]MBC5729550.1 IS3 family transposase [Pseudoflavonifractor hominis]
MRYDEKEKRTLVSLYYNGKSVTEICQDHQIPRSTFYSWIQAYRPVESKDSSRTITPKDFDTLLRRCGKQEQIIAVLKSIPAITNATTQEKLAVLEPLYGQFSVHVLCKALDVPRGTFYNHIKRNKRDNSSYAKHREELRTAIQEIFEESRQTFGSERICAVLHERGYRAGTTLVRELMTEMGLSSVSTTSKRQWKKSNSYERKANILQRQFHVDAPNCIWISDVTCMKLKDRYYYLCAIVDLYSRKVIAHKVSTRNSTQLITATLRMAYDSRMPGENLIFHSDQGSQYTSHAFRQLLKKLKITQSFSNAGTPHDNAVMESFFAMFKKEEFYRSTYRSEAELRKKIDEYIAFYNQKRPHTTLNLQTPEQYEDAFFNEQ